MFERLVALTSIEEPGGTIALTRDELPELLALAGRHGLSGVVAARLARLASDEEARRAAEALFRQIVSRQIVMASETARLARLLRDGGVDALVYKGAALLAAVERVTPARESSDIDLLVGEGELSRAREVLVSRGYRRAWDVSAEVEREAYRYDCEQMFVSSHAAPVDLHWKLTATLPVRFDTAGAFARARTVALPGGEVRTFATADLLLALVIHAAKQGWSRLEWVRTIAAVAFLYPEDVALAVERARAAGCERALALSLELAEELYRVPRVASLRPSGLADRALALLGSRDGRRGEAGVTWRAFDTHGQRLAFAIASLFRPMHADWQWLALPRGLRWLYPMVRLARLAGKGPGR